MPTLEANGQTLHYEEHGDPAAEPLLCVMGLAADSLAWALQVQPFSERYRTVTFDNRDVGRSSMSEGPYEIADMAADTLGLADGLGIERFHLIGTSMGGAISQEVALAAPDRVRSLTLAVTYASGGGWAKLLSELWGARAARATREERIDEMLLLTLSEGFFDNPGALEMARALMLRNPNPQAPEAFARQLAASSRHDASGRLGSLSMPVHVVAAEYDLLIPVWKSQELAALIPGSTLTVLEKAAHGMQAERALEFNEKVLSFLAET